VVQQDPLDPRRFTGAGRESGSQAGSVVAVDVGGQRMKFWLDLFTGTTWREFQNAGAHVSGHRHRMRKMVAKIEPGDILLCYLTGVMRWVGALEVVGRSRDVSKIWTEADFPERLEVRPVVVLAPEVGVPMNRLEGKTDFFRNAKDRPGYRGFLRASPAVFKKQTDGEFILQLLREAQEHPVPSPVDPKKLARKAFYRAEVRRGKTVIPTAVSVPDEIDPVADGDAVAGAAGPPATTRHTEIQHHLLRLGAELDLDVWVARNDRSRVFEKVALGEMPRMLTELPTQFNEATTRTVELIDVLWLKGNTIVAAFEVECTTSIYSGLLRMSDLMALQPNLDINLYLVAPDERRQKVQQEMRRPTFSLRERPLWRVCGFLAFRGLMEKIDGIRALGLAASLRPAFLKTTAEYFADEGLET
jgi:hypothetical protein